MTWQCLIILSFHFIPPEPTTTSGKNYFSYYLNSIFTVWYCISFNFLLFIVLVVFVNVLFNSWRRFFCTFLCVTLHFIPFILIIYLSNLPFRLQPQQLQTVSSTTWLVFLLVCLFVVLTYLKIMFWWWLSLTYLE